MADLQGEIALVTGAGRGIGAATVRRLAAAGATVALHYHASAAAAQAVAEAAGPAKVKLFAADLAAEGAPARLLAAVEAALGPVAYLVNNAALTPHPPAGAPWDGALAARALNVNLRAPMELAFAARQARAIVNVGSANTLRGDGSTVYFAVSKGGVPAMTYALARRLAPQVRVNAVLPGLTDTEEIAERGPGFEPIRQEMLRRTPMGRMGTADEIAEVIVYLLAGNSFLTGAVMAVDGGQYL